MQVTIIGVYENLEEARQTQGDLESSGFAGKDIQIARQNGEGRTSSTREGESGFKKFFKDLFGGDGGSQDVALYEGAVTHGKYVLTVKAENERSTLATDVMNRHHPVDIEEKGSQWMGSQETYSSSATRPGATQGTSSTMPFIEEQLKVGKRLVQRGGVRIYQRVSERPVEEQVTLRQERAKVERTPVNRQASPTELASMKEGSVEIREQQEEPVVEKTARVVEEVRVGKEASERTQKVSGKVKRTDVEVEKLGAEKLGDEAYRAHFDKNYATSGGKFDDYSPAYLYGSRLATDDRYSGRKWEEAETDVRRDWETRHPGSKWEQFKGAIRHAWERATKR